MSRGIQKKVFDSDFKRTDGSVLQGRCYNALAVKYYFTKHMKKLKMSQSSKLSVKILENTNLPQTNFFSVHTM